MSATEKSLALMRKRGFICAIVEHFNPWVKIRQDLWGIADIECYDPSGEHTGVTYVQTTTGSNHSSHKKKILESKHIRGLLACSNSFELHSWKKYKNRWTPRIEEITLSSL
jgi:hypothetical protein